MTKGSTLSSLGSTPRRRPAAGLGSGVVTGVGLATTIDEVVFHQLLHWHHLVDHAGPDVGLVSDGVLHALGTTALVVGLLMQARLRLQGRYVGQRWAGAVLLGLGGFQVYDGTVQHKLLGLHQVRYGVDLLPYDLAWNAAGLAAMAAGAVLLARERRRSAAPAA